MSRFANYAALRNSITEILDSPESPPYTMNIDQLEGYLRALASELKPTTIKEWMPLVFGGELPTKLSIYSENFIRDVLIELYNLHRMQILNNVCELSFDPVYSVDRNDRLQSEQWARGFMQGYIFWQDAWGEFFDEKHTNPNQNDILPSSLSDEIDDILVVISAVADADYAVQSGTDAQCLVNVFKSLPQKLIDYGRIAQLIRVNYFDKLKAMIKC